MISSSYSYDNQKFFVHFFQKSGRGQGAAVPCGILKGEALKLPKYKTKFAYANFDSNYLAFNHTGGKNGIL